MADHETTPPKPGPSSAFNDTPATPCPSTAADSSPMPATPSRQHEHTAAPSTPRPSSSPFPNRAPRTPRFTTPGGSVSSCTTDESLYMIVTVHTAKCSECDKRNMDTMRRCPGCTFQVCNPCYGRREKADRGLMHGTMLSGGSSATPSTQRTVRRKPVASSPAGAESSADMMDDGVDGKAKARDKGKEKAQLTSRTSVPKRVARKRQPQIVDSETEGILTEDDEDFLSDYASPTPSKRPRTTHALDGPASSPTTGVFRKPSFTRSQPHHRDLSSAGSASTVDPSIGGRPSDIDRLMRTYGVNTPENPYQSHLLSRHEPVVSNRIIEIPDIVKRNFKPRVSQEEIQKRIQENTLKKLREKNNQLEAQHIQAEEVESGQNVDAFAETGGAKHQNEAMMDVEQNENSATAMETAAQK